MHILFDKFERILRLVAPTKNNQQIMNFPKYNKKINIKKKQNKYLWVENLTQYTKKYENEHISE